MRKVIGVWLLISFLLCEQATATQYAYQVTFTDKNNTPYSLSSPLTYLSARAMARRTMQGIAVDSTDLPVNRKYIDSVLTLTGGKFHEASRWLNMCVILLSDSSQIHTLDGISFVSSTKMIAFYTGALHRTGQTTGGTSLSMSRSVQRTTSGDGSFYSNTWNQTLMVHGNALYDQGYTGAGKLIAVLDAGFLGTDTHPGFDSLWTNGRVLDEHNFTLDTDYVFSYDTHGTSVLSTMAGYVPGTFVGCAPRASYALYVTEDDSSEQPIELVNMLCGAERADSLGADIITSSLGYNIFDNPAYNFTFATDFDGKTTTAAKAANMATKKGLLFVASAGNEGGDSWNMILTPGDADSAITIGSVDITETNAANSGYGPNAAGRVKPDVCTLGQPANVFTQTDYGAEDGTSFSTPQIAGWAACLWQQTPAAIPAQIRLAIIKCASEYTTPGTQIGYGIPNFECTSQLLNVRDTPPPFTPANWVIATPNPFAGQVTLAVSPNSSGNVDFQLMDMAGKEIFSARYYLDKGYNTPFSIYIPELPVGIYVLKAISATQHEVLKLEKRP